MGIKKATKDLETNNSIKKRLARNKTILANFSYLSIIQVFAILFPLLTYPYLLRVIGSELYGTIAFAQAIISYVSLVINFGFNTSSAKDVAVFRDDEEKLNRIVSSTYLCKFLIWLICLFFYMGVISMAPFFKEYYWVYAFSFLLTLNDLLLPTWFFQGIEKMRYITIVNILTRSIFVVAIFLFVHKQNDYILVPILNGIGAIIAGVLSLYIVIRKENIKLSLVSFGELKSAYKNSAPLFISRLSTYAYINANKVVIGSSLGMSEVSIYDLAEKIVKVMKIPGGIMAQAVFPKISRERNIRYINRVMALVTGSISFIYLILFFTSDWIVFLFMGQSTEGAATIVRILGISAIIGSSNGFLGGNRLVPLGYSAVYMKAMVGNCLFFLAGISLLLIGGFINMYTVTIMAVAVEVFCSVSLLRINRKLGLLHNEKQ